MKAISSFFFVLILPALMPGSPVAGEEQIISIDAEATTVTFTLGATLHSVEGSFDVLSGEIHFDTSTGEASGRVVIDVASGETGNKKRDRDMHAKVLESEIYPQAILEVEGIEGEIPIEGSGDITLRARLSFHGDDHPLTLAVAVAVAADRLEAKTSFPIPYVEWGLKNPSKLLLRVEKRVDVSLKVVGRLER